MLRPPPPWMQAWRRMVAALRGYRIRLWAGLSTATRLGLLPADGYGTPLEDKEDKEIKKEHCKHDPKDMRRYGNMHGSLDSRPRSSFLSLLCAAAVFQQHGLAPPGTQPFSPEQGQAQALDTYYQEIFGDVVDHPFDYQEEAHGRRGGSLDAPAGARGQPGGRGPGQRVRLGSRRRVTGTMDKAVASYEIERNIYDAMGHAGQRPPPAVDLLELFAGTAKPTKFAAELQLRALQPLDRNTGNDLSDPKVQREVHKAIQRTKPWLVVAGYPSTLYSLANENFNYRGQPEQLRQLRDDDRRMRRFVSDLFREQHHQGRFFLLENPQTSRLWQQPEILEIADLPGVSSAVCHLGAFGAETKDGLPVRKPLRFLSNMPEMITDLSQKLSDTDLLFCEPVRGRAAADSHEYPVARIQATYMPMQRRIPMDIPLTARGAALLYNDGTHSIEVEALENVRFPKQRFDKPVRIGIFVYGDLVQESEPAGGQLETLPMSALPTDIRFEGLSPGTPMEVKRTVARLHLNMGHPSSQELTRLACYHGGNLISEPISLASSPGDTAYRAELMRAEALRHLSEFAVERGIRRAILRKTKATAIADISPGQPCAYWRWRRKGVHKKGGWAMAKFLSWDPEHPGKQAWLRTGPTTTLVSAEQLRAAVGFENWVPSQEDIAMLKDGSQSLKDTVWDDQTGPGPKEDYIMDEFDIEAPALESLPPTPVMVPGTP
ncbi:GIP, partial [Symbiodinium sp. CCMP2456]